MCLRMTFIIVSACGFDESRSKPITSDTPFGGHPLSAFEAKA